MVSKRPFFTTRTRSWSPTKIRFQSMVHLQEIIEIKYERTELQNPELRSAIASRSEVISRPAFRFGALPGAPSPDAERHFPPPHKALQLPPAGSLCSPKRTAQTAGWSEIPSTGFIR